jgi:quinoprotein glucose dehydrogenase
MGESEALGARRTWRSVLFGRAWIFAALLLLTGGYLLWGGWKLQQIGGSPYYLVAGLLTCTAAVLTFRGMRLAAALYWALLIGTIAWGFWEAGFNLWALAPRLGLPLVFGVWFLVPWTWRKLPNGQPEQRSALIRRAAIGSAGAVLMGLGANALFVTKPADPLYQAGVGSRGYAAGSADQPGDGDWLHWGRDQGGTRFSALDQITRANVDQLKVSWTYRFGPAPNGAPATVEATPLKVGERLFVCSDYNDVAALDAETGRELWRYRANVDTTNAAFGHCRGVAYYRVPEATGICAQRIYTNTIDARLIALDATTGKPCDGFGVSGVVDLKKGLSAAPKGYYYVTSAPTLARGRLVLGGWISDGQWLGSPAGVIRAFDAVTGKLSWAFDSGQPDRIGEPGEGAFYTRGTPNAWAPMSADEALGLVYVPTGNAAGDYIGAQRRPFDEDWTSVVAALDIETGRPRWKFQTVHHDLWDYDVAAQPTLVDWPTPQGMRPALIQATKRGEIFVLDRQTGAPILPVTERAVPTRGAVPEERVAPTQPFSEALPSFLGANVTEKSMWGVTPLDQLWCRIKFREARYEGPLTPPGLQPSITYPGFLGGSNWGGVSVDLDRRLMIVNSNQVGNYARMVTRAEADALGVKAVGIGGTKPKPEGYGIAPQTGGLYAAKALPFMSPIFAPCQQPPWGRISAVDLVTGKLVWSEPFGTARDSGPLGMASHLPFRVGAPNLGGALTTRSGLTFIAAAQDNYLRAIDTESGKVLWRARLAAGGQASPMTYRGTRSGRQFVALAAGGHMFLNTTKGDYVYAFALPGKD